MKKSFYVDITVLVALLIVIVGMAIGGFISALLSISLIGFFKACLYVTLALLIAESIVSIIRLIWIIKKDIIL